MRNLNRMYLNSIVLRLGGGLSITILVNYNTYFHYIVKITTIYLFKIIVLNLFHR